VRFRPALLVVLAFAVLVVSGTVLLELLIRRTGPATETLVSSAFTSVSAVCVTGLSVVDLSRDTGFGGQLAVLALIQIGGLGVLTLSNWVLLSLRGRLGVVGSAISHATVGLHPRISPSALIKRILVFTLTVEGVGAIVLFSRFSTDYEPRQAVWLAVFHSISAFCNAGFSLFGDSLASYREDLTINLTVMTLVVFGGIGFVVAADLIDQIRAALRGVRRQLTVNTRLVLATTLILILAGTAVFMVFEWKNTFSTEVFGAEILQAFFLSVTVRTAGFNTVETAHLTNMTLVVVMVLMVIGASPGSTGGGVKTTSLIVLWALVRSHLVNRPETEVAGRRIPMGIVAKALALITLYACAVVLGMIALQATEFGELPHQSTRGMFLEHLFEVISALSTVGLSTGVTTTLSDGGLCILMVLMFVGRVGPLVIAASMIGERPRLGFHYAETDIMIG
jgi:trk system potassium uptake protein TrkH